MNTKSKMESSKGTHTDSKLWTRVLNISGFLDLFAVSMIMPLILPQALELGASPTVAGVLGSVYGALQLFSSPIVGKWSDGVSRQFSILVCMILTGLGYSVLGLYSSIPAFFFSRLVLGCFKHSTTISKAFLSDLAKQQSCHPSNMLGNFNSFSSIGFILGPVVGGHMAETRGGFRLVACAAGLVFAANAGLVWWMIPSDDHTSTEKHRRSDQARSEAKLATDEVATSELNLNPSKILASFKNFNWSELWDLLLLRFFAGFSMMIFRASFFVILKERFSASPSTIGYMTSFSGVVAALSGFVIGAVMKRYHNNNAKLLLHTTLFQVFALLALSLAPSLPVILLALVPLNLVTSLSRVSSTTLTVATAEGTTALQGKKKKSDDPGRDDSVVGGVIGLGQSVTSLARMSAPLVAGVAQEVAGIDAPNYISVVSAVVAVGVLAISGRLWSREKPESVGREKED